MNLLKKINVVHFCMMCSTYNAQTTLPYNESFTSGNMPPGIITPSRSGVNNSTSFTILGAELTEAVNNQFGTIILDNYTFNNSNGLQIEFEYVMYEGTASPADGISVFLYDANEPASVGYHGRGLGYAYNRSGIKGVRGGYLMVGFDQLGNSKKQGDVNEIVQGMVGTFGGRNMVVIRGGYNKDGLDDDEKYFYGYPVLATQSTSFKKIQDTQNPAGKRLNYISGAYDETNYNIEDAVFNIRGGAYFNSETNRGYRKAYIVLKPMSGGGFYITVRIKGNDTGTVYTRTVYENLPYPITMNYPENAGVIPAGIDGNSYNVQALNTLPPSLFKIGFSASTGTLNQRHIIKNLTVSLPFMSDVVEDFAKYCYTTAIFKYVSIFPFQNDVLYKGAISDDSTPIGGNTIDIIDYNSFRFQEDNNIIAPTSSNPYNGNLLEVSIPDEGTWVYNKINGEVRFTPKRGFIGVAKIDYTIKGFGDSTLDGPFGQELYRSSPKSISVQVFECGGVVNPNIQNKVLRI